MMKPLDEVRWGIVGCGDVCERKSGPPLYRTPRSHLVAVMSRRESKALDFARRHHVPQSYDDAHALIHDEEVNAVYIATPPGSHLELALEVARAGKPCYVEKPMARSFEECQSMNEAFESRGLPLFVAFYRRGLRRFQRAKSLIESGALGEVSGVSYHQSQPVRSAEALGWRVDAAQSGGGLFLDLASHTLDVLDFLLGPLQNASGNAGNIGRSYDVEDTVSLRFDLESGAPGVGSWNFAASQHEDALCIEGTRARLEMSVFGSGPILLREENQTQEFADEMPENIQAGLIASIVAELLGEGKALSTGRSAARTSRIMDVALEEFYGGRSGEFWKRLG